MQASELLQRIKSNRAPVQIRAQAFMEMLETREGDPL
jgi:hypothetical protein